MPTYSWTLTLEQFQARVLRKLGVIGSAENPSAEDGALVTEALNARLKELHRLGVMWFNVTPASVPVTVTAGVATATVSATDLLFPVSLMLNVGTTNREVELIGHRQYHAIPDKSSNGEPDRAYLAGSTLYLWPVPQSSGTASLTYQAIAADAVTSEALDIPQSMLRALSSVVAADLVDEFDPPAAKVQTLFVQREEALRTLRALNVERVDSETISTDFF